MRLNIRSLQMNQLFLIDGSGALLSALLLCVVYYYKNIFGMPDAMFYQLIPFPVLFACYSITCSFIKTKKRKILLAIIIICNVCYIAYSLLLAYRNAGSLTLPAITYFKLEVLVILALVCLEIDYIKHLK